MRSSHVAVQEITCDLRKAGQDPFETEDLSEVTTHTSRAASIARTCVGGGR